LSVRKVSAKIMLKNLNKGQKFERREVCWYFGKSQRSYRLTEWYGEYNDVAVSVQPRNCMEVISPKSK
jgi:hypothetical protein